jgi:two-component system response regulator VicR
MVTLTVLIIEDDAEVAQVISLSLQLQWPEAKTSFAAHGTKGLRMIESEPFDVVILDLDLPDIDGLKVLEQLRSFSNVPAIIVSVTGDEEDQVRGLEMGADDYILKPFKPRDIIARVSSVLRRHSYRVTEEPDSITRGKLELRLAADEVRLGGEILKLTPTECRLLYVLMKNAEHTLSSKALLQEVWDKEYLVYDIVTTYVRRLRDKLHDNPPRIILSEQGVGYRFVSPA